MNCVDGWSSVPNWVIRSDKLHGTEKWVYITLLNRANARGECWPSLSTLQKEVGVSKNTVLKTLKSLESKGLIQRVRRRVNATEYASNLYRVHTWEGGAETALGGSNENQGVVQPLNQGGSNEDQEVLPIEVLPIRSTTHIPFACVWEAWPKKTERDRAEKEYLKHVKNVPDLAALIATFGEAYRVTTAKRFIPSLAAWLHRKRWTDELPSGSDEQGPSRADAAVDFISRLEEIDATRGGGEAFGGDRELRQ